MKHLLIFIFLLAVITCTAQSKKDGHLFKLSPSMLFPKDGDPVPGIFGSIGGKLNKFIGAGFAVGYYKFKGVSSGIIPVGIDLTFTDFTSKKIMPVFVAQCYYPIYHEQTKYSSASLISDIQTNGQLMFNIGAGIALPTKNKILLTGGIGQLTTKTESSVTTITNGQAHNTKSSLQNQLQIITATVTLVL